MPLVHKMATSRLDFRLFRHLISLGHQLDYEVIAEGVENDELHKLILSTGCTSAQGYYYSHPLPLESFISLLKEQPSWVDHPFGLFYLSKLDIIDFRRDVLRETLIIYSDQDEQNNQRARARLPELRYSETQFAKLYSEIKKYNSDMPEYFDVIEQEYNQFHKTSVELLQLAEQTKSWEFLEQKITEFNKHSANLMKVLIEAATYSLEDAYNTKGNV
jgi:hypothetical protein